MALAGGRTLTEVPWEQGTVRHVRSAAHVFAQTFGGSVGHHVQDKLNRYALTYAGQLLMLRAVGELRRQGLPDEMVRDLLRISSLPPDHLVAAAYDGRGR